MRDHYKWLITDTHFNSKSDFKGHRPANYQEKILHNCRYYVAKQDILIHLGDVIDYQLSDIYLLLESIPCKTKILIRGNHDRQSDNWYLNKGFDFVCDQIILGDVLLSHIPQKPVAGTRINIHGHFHDNGFERCFQFEPHLKEFYDTNYHKLLAVEYTNYNPVRLDEFSGSNERQKTSAV